METNSFRELVPSGSSALPDEQKVTHFSIVQLSTRFANEDGSIPYDQQTIDGYFFSSVTTNAKVKLSDDIMNKKVYGKIVDGHRMIPDSIVYPGIDRASYMYEVMMKPDDGSNDIPFPSIPIEVGYSFGHGTKTTDMKTDMKYTFIGINGDLAFFDFVGKYYWTGENSTSESNVKGNLTYDLSSNLIVQIKTETEGIEDFAKGDYVSSSRSTSTIDMAVTVKLK